MLFSIRKERFTDMMNKLILICLLATVAAAVPISAETGKDAECGWDVVSSGGTAATSAGRVVDGTVAQASVGDASSPGFGVSGGFWQPCLFSEECCKGTIRGNVDFEDPDIDDETHGIDIRDLVYLVEYMFHGGPAPPCVTEANMDASDATGDGEDLSDIDIADLVYLVDFMFTGGPPPLPCP